MLLKAEEYWLFFMPIVVTVGIVIYIKIADWVFQRNCPHKELVEPYEGGLNAQLCKRCGKLIPKVRGWAYDEVEM